MKTSKVSSPVPYGLRYSTFNSYVRPVNYSPAADHVSRDAEAQAEYEKHRDADKLKVD